MRPPRRHDRPRSGPPGKPGTGRFGTAPGQDGAGRTARPFKPGNAPRDDRPPHPVVQPDPEAPRDGERRSQLRLPQGPRPAAPGAARGGLWLYGLHPVVAALGNPARRLRRLLLTAEAEQALLARLPQPWPLTPERVDRARLDQLLGRDAVHQGAGLLADPLAPPALAAALERPGPVIVLDQVSDPRNVGAVLRSAAAFGAACCVVQERNAPDETGALAKAASGALEAVPVLRAVNLARTLAALKAAGLWTVGLAAGAPPLSGPALAARRVALVLGGEGEGLRRLTRDTCDEVAGLGMPGGMESLNVSAAATVALYELARR